MTYKKLDENQIKSIYDSLMPVDFPKKEIRSWNSINNLIKSKNYVGYGFYDNKTEALLAYALFVEGKGLDAVLLDYFAVNSKCRGCGIGSQALETIKNIFCGRKTLLLEVENPEKAENEQDFLMQNRRIEFYLRSKISKSSIKSKVFGADFNVMYFNQKAIIDDKHIFKMIDEIYGVMFGDRQNVMIYSS